MNKKVKKILKWTLFGAVVATGAYLICRMISEEKNYYTSLELAEEDLI